MRKEVSGKALGLFVDAVPRLGVLEAFFAGTGVDPLTIPAWVSWEVFAELCARLGRLCGGPDGLRQLGATLIQVPSLGPIVHMLRLGLSPRFVYWANIRWGGPSLFPTVLSSFAVEPDGSFAVRMASPAQDRDCPEFFLLNEGLFRALPRIVGLPDAHVELELTPRAAAYTIVPPSSMTLLARLARAFRLAFQGHEALDPPTLRSLGHLVDQQHLLQEQFHELRAARSQAEAQRALAVEALRARSKFVATVSHEVRTPLHVVIGTADLLARSDLDPSQRAQVATIRRSGADLLALIEDILDFSSAGVGPQHLARQVLSVRQVVAEVVGMMAPIAERRQLALHGDVADDVPQAVIGDARRLRQILANLIANAVKFTPEGGITVRVEPARRDAYATGQAEAATELRFLVRDTGVGIDVADQEHIFAPFAQVMPSRGGPRGGTGLGLAVCRQLVEAQGGTIGVDSTRGQGSTFWFTLAFEVTAADAQDDHWLEPPLAGIDRDAFEARFIVDDGPPTPARPPKARRAKPATPPRPGRHVLVVEDNQLNQQVLVELLEALGCTTDVAGDGDAALAKVARRPYDLVLMDCEMPRRDGFATAEALRAREAPGGRTPIVAVTAFAADEDRARALAAGMDDYLCKPVPLAELQRTLERWLARG